LLDKRFSFSNGTHSGETRFDILAAVKRTAIPHHATFLEWSLNGVDASPKNA
jgi:hypothetical protein